MEVLFERLTGERWQGLINDGYEYLHMKGISRIEVGGKEVSCFLVVPLYSLMGVNVDRSWVEAIASVEVRELMYNVHGIPVYMMREA